MTQLDRNKLIEACAKARFNKHWSVDAWEDAGDIRKQSYIEEAEIYINAFLAELGMEVLCNQLPDTRKP